MKNWSADAIALLFFTLFMIIVAAMAFANDAYNIHQKYHTFQVAYESAMNCRSAVGASRDYESYRKVNEICQQVPKWEDYT